MTAREMRSEALHDSVDITCIVNLHREGCLAHRTLTSVFKALQYAETSGLHVEILCICDRPDEETLCMLQRNWAHLTMVSVDFGDLGLSRNQGVALASGEYICFVDGDDLVSNNWFLAAYQFGQKNKRFIMHPELNVVFGHRNAIFRHCNQSSNEFRNAGLAFDNFWTALSFAHRSIYEKVPYESHPLELGYGFEDWHFNCLTIAAGYRHRSVPLTAHFIRAKDTDSLSQDATRQGALLRHNALFESAAFMSTRPVVSALEHLP